METNAGNCLQQPRVWPKDIVTKFPKVCAVKYFNVDSKTQSRREARPRLRERWNFLGTRGSEKRENEREITNPRRTRFESREFSLWPIWTSLRFRRTRYRTFETFATSSLNFVDLHCRRFKSCKSSLQVVWTLWALNYGWPLLRDVRTILWIFITVHLFIFIVDVSFVNSTILDDLNFVNFYHRQFNFCQFLL